jgi:hypothetical protein
MNVQLVESIKQVIRALSWEEQEWLRSQLAQEPDAYPKSKMTDLNQYSGVIQLREDPLDFQSQIRGEWL